MGIESWDCGGQKVPYYSAFIPEIYLIYWFTSIQNLIKEQLEMFELGPIWSHCHENLQKLNNLHPEPYKEDKGSRFHSVNGLSRPDVFSSWNKLQILPNNVSKEILLWTIFSSKTVEKMEHKTVSNEHSLFYSHVQQELFTILHRVSTTILST